MTNQTQEINAGLEIVKLDGQTFKVPGGYAVKKGFALKHPELGFFCFGHPDKDGYILPYTPKGGKSTLKEILDAGGFTNFDTAVWLQEMKAPT